MQTIENKSIWKILLVGEVTGQIAEGIKWDGKKPYKKVLSKAREDGKILAKV